MKSVVDQRAERHKPQTREEIFQAAQELSGRGYSVHTVAAILKLDVIAVHDMLGEPKPSKVSP